MSSACQKTSNKDWYILVVDDEEDVRNYLRTALEDAGFRVGIATDGGEALESVKRERPDMISLDLVMPRYSGATFFRELQKDKELSNIPVLIVTGHARDDLGKADFDSLTMSGSGIYLEKPVKPHTYVVAVSKLLGIEPPELVPDDSDQLRGQISQSLEGADPDALQKALDALKKK
ncbi:MAG: response regulator [Candidatus Electryoneaceae bacterium]|nr:response regulator [Candidatus Electryoneaceae bacterium]